MTLRWRSNWVTRPFEGPSNDTLDWGSVDMGGYVRLSQTVAAVIVAPRWASYRDFLTHVVISDPSNSPQIRQFNKSYFFPDSQSHHRFRHYNCHQTPLSVPYGAEKEPK